LEAVVTQRKEDDRVPSDWARKIGEASREAAARPAVARPAPSLRRALLWGAAIGGGLGLVAGLLLRDFVLFYEEELAEPAAAWRIWAAVTLTVFFGALLGAILGGLLASGVLAWWWYVGLVALVVALFISFYAVAGVLLGVLVVGALVRLIRQWRRRAR